MARRTGIVNVNVEPSPTWLFTQIRPLVEFDNLPGTKLPEPVPFAFFLTSASGLDIPGAGQVLLELRYGDDACARNETLVA
jgi:hypothetical protein